MADNFMLAIFVPIPICLVVGFVLGQIYYVLKRTGEAVPEAIRRGAEESGKRREIELRELEEARLPVSGILLPAKFKWKLTVIFEGLSSPSMCQGLGRSEVS
jgi:hypothetical protein